LKEESVVDFMDASELKQRRKALGLSVPELAEKLGVTRISLYRWEREGVKERVAMLRLALLALEMLQVRGDRDEQAP
jgi:transcriptional regulator with XRE-family HTH domain